MGLELTLLGTPQATVDGAPLQVDTRKAMALLAYLAVAGPRQGRDRLAALLWPESPEDRARAALRRTLSVLSSALGGRWVSADRSLITLDRDAIDCDVTALRGTLRRVAAHQHEDIAPCTHCHDQLRHAASVARGEFLQGFSLRDAAGFEDWQILEAEAVRRDTSSALEQLVDADIVAGELEDALDHARRWLELDPLHEQAHRIVMRVAAWLGRRDEAIRQYRTCIAVLDRELGVAPLPSTTALYDQIIAGTVSPRDMEGVVAQPPASPVGEAADELPLVGRRDERRRLQGMHASSAGGTVVSAVIGETGIGKTRLVTEFVEQARSRGSVALTARCHEDESGLACAPVVDLLRGAIDQRGWLEDLPLSVASEVGRLLPEVGSRRPDVPPALPLESPGAQARFFGGIRDALGAATRGPTPGVVVIDDVHWADPTTIDLLGFLGRRGLPDGPLVVLAWRTDAVPHDHPVRRLAPPATTITLGRLDRNEVAELVAAARPDAGDLGGVLYDETQGIPFFVVEYLAVPDAGTGSWTTPAPVRELLEARLRRMSDLGQQVITAAAVLGRSADLATLVRTSGRTEDEVVVALEELLARHLLEELDEPANGGPHYAFTHPRIRDVALTTASLARRRVLHRRAARALTTVSAAGNSAAGAARAAHHLREAGLDTEAATAFARAARHARTLYANREAIAHLDAARGLGHPDLRAIQQELGELYTLVGRYRDALTALRTALALSEDPDDQAALTWRIGGVHLRAGELEPAEAHLRDARDRLVEGRDPALEARILSDLALVTARAGRPEEAASLAGDALATADASGDAAARTQAHNILGVLARLAARPVEARDHLAAALAEAGELEDPSARIAGLNNLALVLADQGQHEAAIADLLEAAELCAVVGDLHREAALHNNLADSLHRMGREEEAMVHLKRAVALFAEVGEPGQPQPEIWKLVDW